MNHYLTVYGKDDFVVYETGPLLSTTIERIKAAIGGFAEDDPKGIYSYHVASGNGLHVYLEPGMTTKFQSGPMRGG